MNWSDYDFIDFGASTGECIKFAKLHFKGVRGVGVDIDPRKVKKMVDAGYDCILADITKMNAPKKCVKFVTMSHVLEHLPDVEAVKAVLEAAADLASDFLFIRGPNFDDDDYLRNLGLKWYWSDWRGHTYHITTATIHKCLDELSLYDRYLVHFRATNTTADPGIHPLSSPIDQHQYDASIHPEKPLNKLDTPVYKEFACFVRLRPFKHWKSVIKAVDNHL